MNSSCLGQLIHQATVCLTLDQLAEDNRSHVDATKLSSVRLKLEEKRRQIEMEKRKLELALSRQQQKVGQAAFLQAINKVSVGEGLVVPLAVYPW